MAVAVVSVVAKSTSVLVWRGPEPSKRLNVILEFEFPWLYTLTIQAAVELNRTTVGLSWPYGEVSGRGRRIGRRPTTSTSRSALPAPALMATTLTMRRPAATVRRSKLDPRAISAPSEAYHVNPASAVIVRAHRGPCANQKNTSRHIHRDSDFRFLICDHNGQKVVQRLFWRWRSEAIARQNSELQRLLALTKL